MEPGDVPTFREFEAEAENCWAAIPPSLMEGVVGLFVHPETKWDPDFPDVPLMGECAPEGAASLIPGAPVRSTVHLYYGSFAVISEREPGLDWSFEIEETILHELRHHLDWRQGHDALGLEDDLQRENMLREAGEPFAVDFYLLAPRVAPGVTCLDAELFFDLPLSRKLWRHIFTHRAVLRWYGRTFTAGPAEPHAERPRGPLFLPVDVLDEPEDAPKTPGGLDWQYATLVLRRRGWFERTMLTLDFRPMD